MPATPHMFAVVRPDGYGKPVCITVPFIGALLEPMEVPQRYYVLPPEPGDELFPSVAGPGRGKTDDMSGAGFQPAPEPRRRGGNTGARPRALGREIIPLDE